VLKGGEKIVTTITQPRYFSDKAAEIGSKPYMILPTKLTARRFENTLQFDLDEWKTEAAADAKTVLIESSPIPGIAPVREILVASGEEPLMHEVVSEAEPENPHNYSISYIPIGCRSMLDCSLHFADIRILPEPVILRIGTSVYDAEIIEINKKYASRRKRVKSVAQQLEELQASLILNAFATASMTLTDDPMRNPNYEEELEMAESLLHKVFEWLAKKQKEQEHQKNTQ
jgi:hypothetical protein